MKKIIYASHTNADGTPVEVHCTTHDCPDCGEPIAWERDDRPMRPDRVARAQELHDRDCSVAAIKMKEVEK